MTKDCPHCGATLSSEAASIIAAGSATACINCGQIIAPEPYIPDLEDLLPEWHARLVRIAKNPESFIEDIPDFPGIPNDQIVAVVRGAATKLLDNGYVQRGGEPETTAQQAGDALRRLRRAFTGGKIAKDIASAARALRQGRDHLVGAQAARDEIARLLLASRALTKRANRIESSLDQMKKPGRPSYEWARLIAEVQVRIIGKRYQNDLRKYSVFGDGPKLLVWLCHVLTDQKVSLDTAVSIIQAVDAPENPRKNQKGFNTLR